MFLLVHFLFLLAHNVDETEKCENLDFRSKLTGKGSSQTAKIPLKNPSENINKLALMRTKELIKKSNKIITDLLENTTPKIGNESENPLSKEKNSGSDPASISLDTAVKSNSENTNKNKGSNTKTKALIITDKDKPEDDKKSNADQQLKSTSSNWKDFLLKENSYKGGEITRSDVEALSRTTDKLTQISELIKKVAKTQMEFLKKFQISSKGKKPEDVHYKIIEITEGTQ